MLKEEILSEIRRTAEENGGRPLGRMRFQSETGIKPADWLGRHWARWSDAIQEAGYTPNSLRRAIDESTLLLAYISLTRELGHIPVDAELRLRARADPEFPSHSTFSRLGTKATRLRKVMAFCQRETGFDDVLQIYRTARFRTPEDGQPEQGAASPKVEMGSVYLLRSGRYYKIGRSNAHGRRERELAIQLPEKAKIVHVIRTDDPKGIEAYWHQRFAESRKNGEWFQLSPSDVAAFRRRKVM